MTNADRFIDAYNRVDRQLEGGSSGTDYVSFATRVRKSKLLVDSERDFLLDIGPLRNAIVHTRGSHSGYPIADPRIDVVEKLEKQALRLEDPPRVLSVLRSAAPAVHEGGADIGDFLAVVTEKNSSQFVCRDAAGELRLITTNATARWFAAEYVAATGVALESASIARVATHGESGDGLVVRDRDITVVPAWRLFAGLDTVTPPAALVLTHSGKPTEKPLGICSRSDVPGMLRAILE